MQAWTCRNTLLLTMLFSAAVTTASSKMTIRELEKKMGTPMIINSDQFTEHIIPKRDQTTRPYSSLVLFTALNPDRGCDVCTEGWTHFAHVAKAAKAKTDMKDKLYFAMIDIDGGGEGAFQMIGAESYPFIVYFPKDRSVTNDDVLSDYAMLDPVDLSHWITKKTGIKIKIVYDRPPDMYRSLFQIVAGMLALCLLVCVLKQLKIHRERIIFRPATWALPILAFIYMFMSGAAIVHMEQMPFWYRHPRTGQTLFFSPGHGQFGAEACVLAFMYAGVTVGFVIMQHALQASSKRRDAWKRKAQALMGLLISVTSWICLLTTYRHKDPSYPEYTNVFKRQFML